MLLFVIILDLIQLDDSLYGCIALSKIRKDKFGACGTYGLKSAWKRSAWRSHGDVLDLMYIPERITVLSSHVSPGFRLSYFLLNSFVDIRALAACWSLGYRSPVGVMASSCATRLS